METIEVDGLRIAYERAGDGPPLILLHGFVGDGRTLWRPQIEGLSDAFTVVAWDAPGAGRSSDPPEPFGVDAYADCLAGFIEGLGLEEPHVAGLSFGAALALALYRRHPVVPRTLILASAYAGWAGSLPAPPAPAATIPGERDDHPGSPALAPFHPLVREWFERAFPAPTPGPGARLAGDRGGREQPHPGPDGLGQDARRLPLGAQRPRGRPAGGADARRSGSSTSPP